MTIFSVLTVLCFVKEYQTRDTVLYQYIHAPRREWKIRRTAEYVLTEFEVIE